MIDIKPFVDTLNEGIEQETSLSKEQKKRIIDFNNAHIEPEVFEQKENGEWVKIEK